MPESTGHNPLVSVITPTYNHEGFIACCLESVLAQTCQDWEQIVLDDGSTDRTAEIVQSYSDVRIRYCYQNHAGIESLAQTYNRALGMARGQLIAILEGDDFWPAGKLAQMVLAFRDPSLVLAFGEMWEVDAAGRPARRRTRTARERSRLPRSILFNNPPPAAAAYMLTLPGHSMVSASTVLIRRSALEDIGGFQYVPGLRFIDFPTFIRLATRGKFFYSKAVLGYRRMYPASATAVYKAEMVEAAEKFRRQLMAEECFGLTPKDRRRIERSWLPMNQTKEFSLGRLRLLEYSWAESRRHFSRALGWLDLRVSAGAILGWIFSWFHCDLEILFRLVGRTSLKADS